MSLKREIIALFCLVLGTIKIFYELRQFGIIGRDALTSIVFLVLIVPAWLHNNFRGLGIRFFETGAGEAIRSLKLFAILAVAIFPPFLVGNHFYQKIFWGAEFRPDTFTFDWATIPTQILLVALPEEIFFRGYLQTLVSKRVDGSFRFLGLPALTMSWGVPLASLIFALSHTFITFRWWHFAIFFPGLAFGWLREKTNGLIAPVLFHALCNLVVIWMGSFYQ